MQGIKYQVALAQITTSLGMVQAWVAKKLKNVE
jgi:hypothetical protein